MWLLTHDSKATPFTRLLFALEPWYALTPRQLDGLRVASVYDPQAVGRAWALQLLAGTGRTAPPEPPATPEWVRQRVPWLGRFWGEGLDEVRPRDVDETIFNWAEDDPDGLRAAARWLADGRPPSDHPGAARLMALLSRYDDPSSGRDYSAMLLRNRPEAIFEAALILIARGEAVRRALLHPGYRDPEVFGGFLDRDLPGPDPAGMATTRP